MRATGGSAQAKSLLGASLLAQARYAEAEAVDESPPPQRTQPLPGPQGRELAADRARLVTLYRSSDARQKPTSTLIGSAEAGPLSRTRNTVEVDGRIEAPLARGTALIA